MRWLLYPFWNDDERRLRALWRVLVQLAVLICAAPIVQYAMAEASEAAHGTDGRGGHPEALFAQGAIFMVWTGVVVWSAHVGARYLDRRPFDDLGLRVDRGFWLDLAFGAVLGGVLMAGILFAELGLGVATYGEAPEMRGEVPRWAFVPMTVFAFLAVSVFEELIFRGYQLTNLAEGLTTRWTSAPVAVLLAVILSSVAFGFAHAQNPNVSAFALGNIALAGVMLAAGFITTGELAIPIGLHLGWNLFQNLFGMAVSGQTQFDYGRVLAREVHGPAWLTGGAFGPEAGMTGLVAIVAGTALTLGWVRMRRGPLRIHPSFTRPRGSPAG